jgi:hypothetical protein
MQALPDKGVKDWEGRVASAAHQSVSADQSMEEDRDALTREVRHSRVSRSGRFTGGAQESINRSEHLFIQLEGPGVAFGPLLLPSALFDHVGVRHTLDQSGGLPFSSPPRRVTVSRSPGWAGLGYCPEVVKISPTGVSPSMPTGSTVFGYQHDFLLPAGSAAPAGQSRYPDHATPAGFNT